MVHCTVFATGVEAPDDASIHHSYVDDCVFQVLAMPTDIMGKTQCALVVLTDVFSSYGFTVNFSSGKTEVMLDIRGTGARKIRAKVFSHKDTKLTFSVAGLDCNVEVVPHVQV